ncbi:MAG: hypothetical protein MRQ07_02580 [Candidatus Midichloria sp.]|nr:hypothetical protein [Candidatus Midichloria sp.]
MYTLGLFFAITCLAEPFKWAIITWLYGKNIDQFSDCMLISDIMTKLYGEAGRWVTNIASLTLSVTIVAIGTTAIGLYCEPTSSKYLVSTVSLLER